MILLTQIVVVLKTKIQLKGALTPGKIVLDSIPFAEYFFGKFENLDNAEAVYVNLSNNIAEALNRKVLFKNEDGNNKTDYFKQTKIAFHSKFWFLFVQYLCTTYLKMRWTAVTQYF
ncbi:MAG: hypothetical protein V9E96_05940 [Chitinophagaceae bacterium]